MNIHDQAETLKSDLASLRIEMSEARKAGDISKHDEEKFSAIADFCEMAASRIEALEKSTRVDAPELHILDPEQERFVKAIGLEKVQADENGDLRIVSGIVLEPDVTDAQGDTYNADEIRKTAHLYMIDFRNTGLQHKAIINDKVDIVESYLAPIDMTVEGQDIAKGTWILTVKVHDDDIWADIKSGRITGFSIGGFAKRIPIEQKP